MFSGLFVRISTFTYFEGFCSSGMIITMKSIDMYILHDSSLGVCFSKRSHTARWRVGQGYILVLVFAATCSEMALGSVLFDPEWKMAKLLMYKSNSQKLRMDYSRNDGY